MTPWFTQRVHHVAASDRKKERERERERGREGEERDGGGTRDGNGHGQPIIADDHTALIDIIRIVILIDNITSRAGRCGMRVQQQQQ